MAAPSYTHDLTVFDDATATTNWTGFSNHDSDTAANSDTDYFIYGTSVINTEVRKTGATSLVYDNGANVALGKDGAFFCWFYYLAPGTIEGIIDGGIYAGFGTSISDYYLWYMDGSSSYAYSGWLNYAVCPEMSGTADYNTGTPAPGDHQVAGSGVTNHAIVSKGNPLGADIIRYGRGDSRFQDGDLGNGYCTFNGFATINDNPLTGRFGLIQEIDGGYLWKGLMSIGYGGTSADFRDSNTGIVIDDTTAATSTFNRIEINEVGTNVYWNSITVTSLGTTSPGQFEMIDNARVTQSSCVFTDMDSFRYQSSASMDSTIWRRCNSMIQSSSVLDSCVIDSPNTAISSAFMNVDDVSLITNTQFTMGITGHAIELTTPGTYTWTGNTYTGYGGIGESNLISDTGPGDAVIYNNSSGLITLNAGGGADSPSVRNGAGATTIVSNPVTFTISNIVADSEVRIYPTGSRLSPSDELDGIESSSTSFAYAYEYAGDQYNDIVIHHLDYVYLRIENVFMGNTDAGTSVQQQEDRWYDNPA